MKNKSSEKLKIRSCKYIDLSELFKNCDRAFLIFTYRLSHKKIEFDYSFNNQKMLISPQLVEEIMNGIDLSNCRIDYNLIKSEIMTVVSRLEKISNNTFVNLEG